MLAAGGTNLERRTFLKHAGVALSGAVLAERLYADPYAPLRTPVAMPDPVRVRGRVRSGGRGVAGAAVSDGATVSRTGSDGSFTLISDRSQRFVQLSLPSGYTIPTNETGTARFYHRLPESGDEFRGDFEIDPLPGGDANHAFLVLADTQTQNAFEMGRLHAESVPDVQETVRALGDVPVFGVACGDIMYDHLDLYAEYERAVSSTGVPFFQVIGNHDLDQASPTDEDSGLTFQHHFGPAHYSFERGEVHYIVLDDVFWYGDGYIGYLEQRQLRWMAADLAGVESGRTVVVFLHIPALSTRNTRNGEPVGTGESVTNREALYRLLEPYNAFLLSGHTHEHEFHNDGGVRHHVHGTVCGAWWSGDICWDGTPNGYGVYEVNGSEVRWRYKATGRPPDHQLQVYPRGSDPLAPDEIVANVWGADENWNVVWYQNGELRGPMARRNGYDPRSVREQLGPEQPPRRQWVEPTTTSHLYYAPVEPGALLRVEATDPWGTSYSAEPASSDSGG